MFSKITFFCENHALVKIVFKEINFYVKCSASNLIVVLYVVLNFQTPCMNMEKI